ncbi:MAG TPA: FAD binding domain-containing protein [Solirubrobacteraceae bacterium]|nr:FAD binding domain-containing protein [Solirubrobacteraceae bacterium]
MGVELLRPASLQEAVDSLSTLGERARPLAGGTALVLLLGQGLLSLDCLVDLRHIPGLDKIEHEPGTGLALGALVSHRALERSPLVRAQLPFLAEVFHHVANVRVRNQATVGGVLAEADYASDPPAALIALNARVRVIGPNGERELSVAELLRGWYETSLAGGEIIRDVVVPDPPPDTKFAYRRFVSRSTQDRPCASITIALRSSGDRCAELRVVVGAVAATPQEFPDLEQLAHGEQLSEALARKIAQAYAIRIEPLSDARGSAWYRRQVVEVMLRRTLLEVAA